MVLKRIFYFPTFEDVIFLAENYNVNVKINSYIGGSVNAILMPTNTDAAMECVLMGLPTVPQIWDMSEKSELRKWLKKNADENWLNDTTDYGEFDNIRFITYHN